MEENKDNYLNLRIMYTPRTRFIFPHMWDGTTRIQGIEQKQRLSLELNFTAHTNLPIFQM